MAYFKHLPWKCHTPLLLEEILTNDSGGILKKPLQIFGEMLHKVAERALELNDPALNDLMCTLTLYSAADPESPDYDLEMIEANKKLIGKPVPMFVVLIVDTWGDYVPVVHGPFTSETEAQEWANTSLQCKDEEYCIKEVNRGND